jgi:hypothetical protein
VKVHRRRLGVAEGREWTSKLHKVIRFVVWLSFSSYSFDREDPLWHCVVGDVAEGCYQWLPSEVDVSRDGACRFVSYINNLAPRDAVSLTPMLEELLALFVPRIEQVLQSPDGNAPYSLKVP